MAEARLPAIRLGRTLLTGLAVVVLLAGCGGGGESHALLVDYQERLATTLGRRPPEPAPPGNIAAFPERHARLLEVAEVREGLLDVYALRECRITNLVAQRNNQLGRVAPASQRWLYELALWRRLDACRRSEVPDGLSPAARDRLLRLTETKTRQLPRVSWNALFDSEEWVQSFSRASSPLDPRHTRLPEAQLDALAYLRETTRRQFDPDWQADSATLEGHLKALRQRPFSAEVLRTLLLAEQRLEEASAMLQEALDEPVLCGRLEDFSPALEATPEGARLADWLDGLEATASTWLGAIDALLEAQVEGPAAVQAYRRRWLSLQAADAPLPALQAARQRHARLRATLAGRCRGSSGT